MEDFERLKTQKDAILKRQLAEARTETAAEIAVIADDWYRLSWGQFRRKYPEWLGEKPDNPILTVIRAKYGVGEK